jgi:DNA-directed RNA polymerase specialized sigma subunit
MQDVIAKIIDMQAEINADIDHLVDLKREIMQVIKAVQNPEHQTLLELRYLCFRSWEYVAEELGYNVRHVYRLHDEAVEQIMIPETCQ